jgi:hypothetical protein
MARTTSVSSDLQGVQSGPGAGNYTSDAGRSCVRSHSLSCMVGGVRADGCAPPSNLHLKEELLWHNLTGHRLRGWDMLPSR